MIRFARLITIVAILTGLSVGLLAWSWTQGWIPFYTQALDNRKPAGNHPPPSRLLSAVLLNKVRPDSSFYLHDSTCTGFHRRHFDPALPGISSGPFTSKALQAETGLEWTLMPIAKNTIDFTQHVKNTQNRVIYLLERRWIGQAGQRLLSAGSDDGLAVWVNGEPVATHHTGRALVAGSDWFPVHLKRGYNTFLFKVDQGNGNWGANLAAAQLHGTAQLFDQQRDRHLPRPAGGGDYPRLGSPVRH